MSATSPTPATERALRARTLARLAAARPSGGGAGRLIAVAALAIAVATIAWATDSFRALELDTVDARFEVRGTETPPDDLVLVAIDDSTFERLQRRFPFPRSWHADVIDNLRRDGTAAVVYDVQFTEPTSPRQDQALIDAVDRAERVALSTTEVGPGGETNVFGGDAVLRRIGARAGNTVIPGDPGGVLRRLPFSVQGLESLPVVAQELTSEEQVDPDAFGEDGAWIDYHGPPGTIRSVPFWRAMRGKFEPGTFQGATVVVGATATSLQDVHPTSIGGDEQMSGAEVQANAISTIRRDLPLRDAPTVVGLLAIGLMAGLAPLAGARLGPLRALAIAVAGGVLYALVSQLAFDEGLILPVVYPLGALAVSAVGTLAAQYLAISFERRRVRDLFARFVPESVVDQVLAQADDELRLGGVQTEGTIMFSDIRGFTTFSESQPAARVVEVLNRYLSEMSDAIFEHGGTITTYIGDGIMAVFGAPIEQVDHADRAVAAARSMLEDKLPRVNAWLAEQGVEEFRIGIGLNSGKVMAGNVGSDRRMEYTAIGDAVNTAARLEGMTKDSGHVLFIADSTREALRDRELADRLAFVEELPVRGRRGTVRVWSLGRG